MEGLHTFCKNYSILSAVIFAGGFLVTVYAGVFILENAHRISMIIKLITWNR